MYRRLNLAIAKGQKINSEQQPTIKELATVTESIHYMAQQLQSSTQDIRNLESQCSRRVEEATNHLKQANRRLNHLANIDGLTQIHNRYYFDLVLQELWSAASQQQTGITLIMCDIDNFKLYNDTYGHLMGDKCLAKVAQAIQKEVRQQDIVARYGGEEIAIILPQTDDLEAVAVADKIINTVRQLNLIHFNSTVSDRVTISCGVASLIADRDSSPLTLLQSADEVLYDAKRQGKNRYVLASLNLSNKKEI